MALFGKEKSAPKKTAKKAVSTEVAVKEKGAVSTPTYKGSTVLIRPHVTEKATDLAERGNVYAFEITSSANKAQVMQSVEKLFKVTPAKIAIINIKPKYMKSRKNNQIVLKKPGLKKALITLKSGDKIEFV